jgi:hypothetical protein
MPPRLCVAYVDEQADDDLVFWRLGPEFDHPALPWRSKPPVTLHMFSWR